MATSYLDLQNGIKIKKSTVDAFTGLPDQIISTNAFGFVDFGFLPLATETTPGVAEIATQAEVDAGLDDERIVTTLKLDNSSRVVHTFGNETIAGVKTFTEQVPIIIDPPLVGPDLEIGYFATTAPDGYGVRTSTTTGYFSFMSNSDFPQLSIGNPSSTIGSAFVDVNNGRPLLLNTLNSGTSGIDGRGAVVVGRAGLEVRSNDAASAPNLRLTTITGSTDWDIFVGSPGELDGWLRFSAVGSPNASEAVLLPSGHWRIQNGSQALAAYSFLNFPSYGMYMDGPNNSLCFTTNAASRLCVDDTGIITAETASYETLIASTTNALVTKQYVDDAIVASGGPAISAIWKYDDTTSSGPSSGEFRTNNLNPALVTELYINEETENGADFANILSSLVAGSRIYLQNIEDSTEFLLVTLNSPGTDNGSDWTFSVTVNDSGTTFDDGKEFGFVFFSAQGVVTEVNDLTAAVVWDIVPDAFISQSSVVQHEAAINHDNLLGFVPNEHIDWTIDNGATNINNANIELAFNDLTDVDLVTFPPQTGDMLYWDGTNWVPSDNATDRITLFQDGCIAEFIDTTGLDLCNVQVGPSAGSAFYIAKRALGTITSFLPVTDGTKIGGYGFVAFDGVTFNPGYVGAEISSTAQGDQDATNGGANIWFEVTQQGTKTAVLALEIEDDGTLSVAGQTDYELKVLDDDDIPNKKYVDDQAKIGTAAFARTNATGTILDGVNLTVVNSATGTYDYTFVTPLPDANYQVIGQPFNTLTDTNAMVSNVTNTGFTITTGLGDNGATPDVLTDTEHSVVVYSTAFAAIPSSTVLSVNGQTGAVVIPQSTLHIESDGAGDNTVNYNLTTPTRLQLSGLVEPSPGDFLWDGANDWVLCLFDGAVEASYNVPTTSTGVRNHIRSSIILEDVPGTGTTERAIDYSYIRNTGGHASDTLQGTTIFQVSIGEKIYVNLIRAGTNGSATNISDIAEINVRRIS